GLSDSEPFRPQRSEVLGSRLGVSRRGKSAEAHRELSPACTPAGLYVRLWSRHGRSWRREFAAITAALRGVPGQSHRSGDALRPLPLSIRRNMLAELSLEGALQLSGHMDGPDGEAMFRHAC